MVTMRVRPPSDFWGRTSQRLLWIVLSSSGCTQTGEVLTKRLHDEQSYPVQATDAAVSPPDAGTSTPAPSVSLDPTTSPPSTSDQHAADAGSSDDTGPSEPVLERPVLTVGAGYHTTCLILNRSPLNVLWCFGEVPIDPNERSDSETAPSGPFVAVTGGEHHMCALDERGQVWCWGDNTHSQLGASKPAATSSPRRVRLPRPVVQLSAGGAHTCAITDKGELHCWGRNHQGQLGVNDARTSDDSRDDGKYTPNLVDRGPWISVSAGDAHTCGVKSDGSLWCWGRNDERQSGNRDETRVDAPTAINTEHSWRVAAVGRTHSCGLRTDGTLWCWGSNAAGVSYPLGSNEPLNEPTQIGEQRWASLSTSAFHTCAVAENGDVACWGNNDVGQLGTGDTDPRDVPTLVGDGARAVVTGLAHSCVVKADQDDVLCTGSNEFGQLPLPDEESRTTFTSLGEEWLRYVEVRRER